MTLPRKTLKEKVESKIKRTTIKAMSTHIQKSSPSLWGMQKPRGFENTCLLIALYHDLFGVGYNTLESEISSWMKIAGKSIRHNTKIIREKLSTWADKQIVTGDYSDWNRACKNLSEKEQKDGVNLWADSSDFKSKQPKSASKKSEEHSYKEDHYADRFTCISNANGKIVKLFGPYSPKVDDNDFMILSKEWLEENMSGGVMLADCGYTKAAKEFSKIKIITPTPKPRGRKRKDGEGITKLTNEQVTTNNRLKALRSRVENPFADIKNRWNTLSKCFEEGSRQHKYVVNIAIGIRNFEKTSPTK